MSEYDKIRKIYEEKVLGVNEAEVTRIEMSNEGDVFYSAVSNGTLKKEMYSAKAVLKLLRMYYPQGSWEITINGKRA